MNLSYRSSANHAGSRAKSVGAKTRLGAGLALIMVALGASHLSAAPPSVKGKLTGYEKLVVDVYGEAANPASKRWSWREPSVAVDPKFRNLSPQISREVCLVATNNAPNPSGPSLLVKVTGGRTNPVTIVVQPETTLAFQNADPFPHTLSFGDKAPELALAPGARVEWKTPNGVQQVEIRDPGFPSLRSYVLTDPNVVQTVYPAHDGSFSFSLTGGDYNLKAFFGGKQVGKTVPMAVKDKGTLDLKEFSVAP